MLLNASSLRGTPPARASMIVSTVLFMQVSCPDEIAAFFSGMPSMTWTSRSILLARFLSFTMYQFP
jgi:hypothetical protein